MKIIISPQFKKFNKTFLAVLFGAGIIFFSLTDWSLFGGKVSPNTKDGTSARDDSRSATKLLGSKGGEIATTTTTSFLARQLLTDYTTAQINKGVEPLSNSETEALAQMLSKKTKAGDTVKQYTEKDLVVVKASASTLETYKKEMTATLNIFTQKNDVDELSVVALAMDTKDQSKLAPLSTNIINLEKLVKDLLVLKVPSSVLSFHISMVQGYTNILSGVVDMQQIIVDPVRGLRGIAKYNNGMGLIDRAIVLLKTK